MKQVEAMAVLTEAMACLKEGNTAEMTDVLSRLVPQEVHHHYVLSDQLFSRRTRFFIKYAKDYSIRLSALLFIVAAHTQKRYREGKRNVRAGWHNTADWYSSQLGIGVRQVHRLVKEGVRAGLLGYQSTGRGMLLWIKKSAIYTELDKNKTYTENGRETRTLGFYYLNRAKALGINGSIIYCFLRDPDYNDNTRRTNSKRIAHLFPWIKESEARKELEKLFSIGAIHRSQPHLQLAHGRIGYQYYYSNRNTEDRIKWTTYKNKKNSEKTEKVIKSKIENTKKRPIKRIRKKCLISGKNVLCVEKMSYLKEKMSYRKSLIKPYSDRFSRFARNPVFISLRETPNSTKLPLRGEVSDDAV
jgi:hypothetical protein